MKDCIYEKAAEQIHCSVCFVSSELVMKALRKEGKLVGHVWMCQRCAGRIVALEAEFSPIYKSTAPLVVAG